MRCNRCGAASRVTYTTEQPDLFRTKRRRICDNNHRFTTYEAHQSIVLAAGPQKLLSRTAGFRKNVRMYVRDVTIWKERMLRKRTYVSLADEYSMAESGIRRIVAKMNKERSGQKLGGPKEQDDI